MISEPYLIPEDSIQVGKLLEVNAIVAGEKGYCVAIEILKFLPPLYARCAKK